MTLGGTTRDGATAVNPLTWMALRVARDVGLIDPKVNLRISARHRPGSARAGHRAHAQGSGLPAVRQRRRGHPRAGESRLRHRGCPRLHGRRVLGVHHPRARHGRGQHRCRFLPGRGGQRPSGQAWLRGRRSRPSSSERRRRSPTRCARARSPTSDCCGRRHPGTRCSCPTPSSRGSTTGAGRSTATWASTAPRRPARPTRWRRSSATSSSWAMSRPPSCCRRWTTTSWAMKRLRERLAQESPRVGLNDPAVDDLLVKLYDWLADACEAELRATAGWSSAQVPARRCTTCGWPVAAAMVPCPNQSSAPRPMDGGRAIRSVPTWHRRPAHRCADPSASSSRTPRSTTAGSATAGPSRSSSPDSVFRGEESIGKVAGLVRTFAHARRPAVAAQRAQRQQRCSTPRRTRKSTATSSSASGAGAATSASCRPSTRTMSSRGTCTRRSETRDVLASGTSRRCRSPLPAVTPRTPDSLAMRTVGRLCIVEHQRWPAARVSAQHVLRSPASGVHR